VPPPLPLLSADCSACSALCCTATSLRKSADFAIDKPPDRPCPNLRLDDFHCRIHDRLRDNGFPGCIAYDCFGAGQRVTQSTFGGRTWRDHPDEAATIFPAFMTMAGVHEVLWHLDRALALCDGSLRAEVAAAIDRTNALGDLPPDELARLDVVPALTPAMDLVKRVSRLARAGSPGPDLAGRSLVGADLRRTDLRGANLRSAVLLGADLRGVDLTRADVGGADLRAARLGRADLSGALFLRPGQLGSAAGDGRTRLPVAWTRPPHWH
jgi:uncharacterized protein YjbI with pentapeptide repeats